MPKVVDHDAQRVALARQCLGLFAEHGYGSLTVRTIARELGVSTGTLYHYFPNKAVLFEAVVRVAVDTDIVEASNLLRSAVPRPRDRLAALLHYVAHHQTRLANHFRVLVEFAATADAAADLGNLLVEARGGYARAIASALEIDDAGKIDLVLIVIAGLIKRAMLGDTTTDVAVVARTLQPLLGDHA